MQRQGRGKDAAIPETRHATQRVSIHWTSQSPGAHPALSDRLRTYVGSTNIVYCGAPKVFVRTLYPVTFVRMERPALFVGDAEEGAATLDETEVRFLVGTVL